MPDLDTQVWAIVLLRSLATSSGFCRFVVKDPGPVTQQVFDACFSLGWLVKTETSPQPVWEITSSGQIAIQHEIALDIAFNTGNIGYC